jgi:NADPH:quinone reductase-like Zn-dependent oxidoreductase
MKAVICTKYGLPDVLEIQDVKKPTPKDNEILVRIIATAVNSGDVRVRGLAVEGFMKIIMRLALGITKPRKPILGTVFSGIVESKGNKVSKFNIGDKVFGMTGFNFGTYAEYIAVKESGNVACMPNNASYEEAVSLIFGGQTAIYFLDKIMTVKKTEPKVLVIGATGSVGSAAIQIAQHYGADITAVCSTEGKPLVESLSVSKIVLYDKEDFYKHTNKFDFIFDAVGNSTKKQCKNLLQNDGIFKTVGGLEYASESQKQLELIKELYENGKLKAIIDKIFLFDEVVDAHKYVDTGRKKGNVVLKICESEVLN